jgi:hypothetical protein
MNQAPEPKWIAGNSKYIPIGILETLYKEFQRI